MVDIVGLLVSMLCRLYMSAIVALVSLPCSTYVSLDARDPQAPDAIPSPTLRRGPRLQVLHTALHLVE